MPTKKHLNRAGTKARTITFYIDFKCVDVM